MEAMAKHRSHCIAFKRQVVQEYLAGETLHGLARRHDVSRNLDISGKGAVQAGGVLTAARQGLASGDLKASGL